MNDSNKTVIIVAGGSGSRMQSERPKQFIEIAGKPIILHTIDAFLRFDLSIKIILVLPIEYVKEWEKELASSDNYKNIQLIAGGATRTASVKNGLAVCPPEGVVGIHDGARPFVSTQLIEKCFQIAHDKGSCVPCIACVDSVRQVSNSTESEWSIEHSNSQSINRDSLYLVQTPQCFDAKKLKDLYTRTTANFSDDASLWELNGENIHLTLGEASNIKITTPIDLYVAHAILTNR